LISTSMFVYRHASFSSQAVHAPHIVIESPGISAVASYSIIDVYQQAFSPGRGGYSFEE